MHIFYISQRDVLKGRVGSIMVMQSCRAFAKTGATVTLIAPRFYRAGNVARADVWQHYGMDESFRIVMLPTLLWDRAAPALIALFKAIWHLLYSLVVLVSVLRRPAGQVVIYSRDPVATWPYLLTLALVRAPKRVAFVYEVHGWRRSRYHRALLQAMDGVVYISEALRRKVEPDLTKAPKAAIGRMGVNVEDYPPHQDKRKLRASIGFPAARPIAMYTGKVAVGMKEIEFIVQAAGAVPEMDVVIVGGNEQAVEAWRSRSRELVAANVSFTGFVSPARVRDYQLAADALIMYYPSDWGVAGVLSPGKMMEYMATGNAIVSVNHAPLVEVLNSSNAVLVAPDSPSGLAAALRSVAADASLRRRLGTQALRDVANYTWHRRAQQLRRFFRELQGNEPTAVVHFSEQSG